MITHDKKIIWTPFNSSFIDKYNIYKMVRFNFKMLLTFPPGCRGNLTHGMPLHHVTKSPSAVNYRIKSELSSTAKGISKKSWEAISYDIISCWKGNWAFTSFITCVTLVFNFCTWKFSTLSSLIIIFYELIETLER